MSGTVHTNWYQLEVTSVITPGYEKGQASKKSCNVVCSYKHSRCGINLETYTSLSILVAMAGIPALFKRTFQTLV